LREFGDAQHLSGPGVERAVKGFGGGGDRGDACRGGDATGRECADEETEHASPQFIHHAGGVAGEQSDFSRNVAGSTRPVDPPSPGNRSGRWRMGGGKRLHGARRTVTVYVPSPSANSG